MSASSAASAAVMVSVDIDPSLRIACGVLLLGIMIFCILDTVYQYFKKNKREKLSGINFLK